MNSECSTPDKVGRKGVKVSDGGGGVTDTNMSLIESSADLSHHVCSDIFLFPSLPRPLPLSLSLLLHHFCFKDLTLLVGEIKILITWVVDI